MSIQRERLLSLIEFAQQATRMRMKPVLTVSQHGLFALYEHELQGLPGISLNQSGADEEDERWLAVERLHETRPPGVQDPVLAPWVPSSQSFPVEPVLREATDGASLIAAGTHVSTAREHGSSLPAIEPNAAVVLSDYAFADQVRAAFKNYLEHTWRPWAREEALRRKTIALYTKLFTLRQQFEGGIVEAQLELVWGVGIGIWRCDGATVSYPLLGRLVELSLDPDTAQIHIRPRSVDARLEIDWYASVDNPGLAQLEKAVAEFCKTETAAFSPFDRGTYEPVLRAASTHLDGNGKYWPDSVPPEDRTLPKATENLTVTDTWVLFARPRTNNLFLQDLDALKKQATASSDFPPAVAAIVTDPDTQNAIVELPPFRGLSASYDSQGTAGGTKAGDLYFPKPFNDEQVRIIQLLEVSNGVVVQGPPGTGKTHTIANVICHYLANGKRVLVTSMKDPALAVLQQQLPAEIRPLAISLLTSEQEGMKQFEHAVQRIAAEVQGIDRDGTDKAIKHLEESIDALHSKLALLDREIGEWARKNLDKITLDAEAIDPEVAAREVVAQVDEISWFPDPLGISPGFAPQFTDADVVRLRDARRTLGDEIDYLDASLPQVIGFPDSKTVLGVHQDLCQFEKLQLLVERGDVPVLADSSQETLTRAQQLLTHIGTLRAARDEVAQAQRHWTATMRERVRRVGSDPLLPLLEGLGTELEQALETRNSFLQRPVTTPAGVELDGEIVQAVANLGEGKPAFGIVGWLGKAKQKKLLDSIQVLGSRPDGAESWKHVAAHLALLKRLRELAVRWNALARELKVELVQDHTPEGGWEAADAYRLYLRIKQIVRDEGLLCTMAAEVFPNWAPAREVAESPDCLAELEAALRHHLTKCRLENVWVQKERCQKVLEGRSGRIITVLRRFFNERLGNPAVTDAEIQAEWSTHLAELTRVLGLNTPLQTVREICDLVAASGAPKYAAALQQPLTGAVDSLLPDNWRMCWRLRRLATHLAEIDAQEQLKRLAGERHQLEGDLSCAYQEVVVKCTWLKLAENASPHVRAALQAYLNAIQRIGKGTGKRAIRYRGDAQTAAAQANNAVPCWIMAHYRVSESLPAELGCFDLVVIDEASQSDLTALPALLRAKKVLIVGDDKQVSPEGVGLEEEKVRNLMSRFLGTQVETYGPQMSPERSIYDLCKVVFASSMVMLKEHFRCVPPIIEYSKREFYNHELRPLRVPKASERLDPPLIDVLVEDGYRSGDVNLPEARFIADEIQAIASDPAMASRSIGVVSLLGDKQTAWIWDHLTTKLGPELMERHRISCGDARTFQGKERDIMFLTMVAAPNYVGAALSRDTFAQRFNVAASRAKNRMYLVRSVEPKHLSPADRLRHSLISHFASPYAQDEARVEDLRQRCESDFERELYDELTQRGYRVTPQVGDLRYRIDLVVEGHNDARLAIECDGDRYHGPDRWADDMRRQRVLERAGWVFWRCFASAFIRRREELLADLIKVLGERGIEPIGGEGAPRSVHCEHRVVRSVRTDESEAEPEAPEPADDEQAASPEPPLPPISTAASPSPVANGQPQLPPDALRHHSPGELNTEPQPARGAAVAVAEPVPTSLQEMLSRNFEAGPDGPVTAPVEPALEAMPRESRVHLVPDETFAGASRVPPDETEQFTGAETPVQPQLAFAELPPVVDPLPQAILRHLTPDTVSCSCGRERSVQIGRFGPYLKCAQRSCATEAVASEVITQVLSELATTCLACGAPVKLARSRYGYFVGCSRYPECKTPVTWKDLQEQFRNL